MIRLLIGIICLVLFFLEPVIALYSPFQIGESRYTFVPRFVLIFLMFVSMYGDRMTAIVYAFLFGLLYDVFFIDIIGLYSFLYPVLCLLAGLAIGYIDDRRPVMGAAVLLLVALFETVLYLFFTFISLTTVSPGTFFVYRLFPSIIGNALFFTAIALIHAYRIPSWKNRSYNYPRR